MTHRFALATGTAFLAIMGTGILGCQQKTQTAAGPISSGTRSVDVVDPIYKMTAMTMQIPANWKFAGVVARPPDCHSLRYSWEPIRYTWAFTAESPDGLSAISMLPGVAWNWSATPNGPQKPAAGGCPPIAIDSAASFLLNIAVPNIRPNAKVIGVVPPPADAKAAAAAQQSASEAQEQNMVRQFRNYRPAKMIVDVASVRLEYLRNGKPVEELISAQIDCKEQQPAAAQPGRFAPNLPSACDTNGIVVIRAPKGHLDAFLAGPQAAGIFNSRHGNRDWVVRNAQDQQKAFDQATADFERAGAAIRAQGQREHDALMATAQAKLAQQEQYFRQFEASDRAQHAAMSGAAHNMVNYSLDRKDFINPTTGQTVNASSEYNHQWMSSDSSTLIQTNSPTYDPNGAVYPVSQSWTELIPK